MFFYEKNITCFIIHVDHFQEYTVAKRVTTHKIKKLHINYDLSKQMKQNYKYSKEKFLEFKSLFLLLI